MRRIVRRVLDYYKRNARKRNLIWDLSPNRFAELIKASCFYCGETPSRVFHKTNRPGELLCNGIDRMDSNIGYVESNVVSCCWACNRMKSAMPVEDFKQHISKIYKHLIGAAIGIGRG